MTITKNLDRKLVIFDDDKDILFVCSYILEQQGWKVFTFTDCNNVINRITDIKPSVILMDNWIPDEGGITATRKLKSSNQLKHIPVIYFSANSDVQALAALAGADSYLAKPFDLKTLTQVIQAAIG